MRTKLGNAAILWLVLVTLGVLTVLAGSTAPEAPTGFSTPTLVDNKGSLSESNGIAFEPGQTMADVQAVFEEQEDQNSGLGPVYNATSCVTCHQNPVTGGSSQVSVLRAGHRDRFGRFVNPNVSIDDGHAVVASRSLINERAICPEAQERVADTENIRTFRMSPSVLGDGFVEAIDDKTIINLAVTQRIATAGRIAGEYILVPVVEAPGASRVGRFGWKDQHASLLSFAADAYLNEEGITSRLFPTDVTSVCKTTSDPEDESDANGEEDIDRLAQFMRATKAPPVDAAIAATGDSQAGARLFTQIGCAHCHVTSLTTAPAGTVINGGQFKVPAALGNKTIHPYSDFLLHNVGTGDGIVQNGPADTATKFRTPPLWGLRTRSRLMHDGLSLTRSDAILRHSGEATFVINNYRYLNGNQKAQILQFLGSL